MSAQDSSNTSPASPGESDELDLGRSGRRVNIIAWSLSAFVIILSVIMLVTTGERVFIVFLILGALVPLNIVFYDKFVLKPKVAQQRARREREESAE